MYIESDEQKEMLERKIFDIGFRNWEFISQTHAKTLSAISPEEQREE